MFDCKPIDPLISIDELRKTADKIIFERCKANGGVIYEQDMGKTVPVCLRDGQYCAMQCVHHESIDCCCYSRKGINDER